MDKSHTIPPLAFLKDAENYPLLRERGVSFLQELSHERWTDHNIHDPGITILELLCYALTDLSYRTSFDFADIVTPNGSSQPDLENQFYPAQEIFPCHPVTISDYRKLILDTLPGIRNVWIKPESDDGITAYEPNIFVHKKIHELTVQKELAKSPDAPLKIKGLYSVKLELDNLGIIKEDYEVWQTYNCYTREFFKTIPLTVWKDTTEIQRRLKEIYTIAVLNLLMNFRNLCEDFIDISFSKTERVTVCADIEVEPTANIQQVWFKIYELLFNYISPAIRFYSTGDLLQKGKTIEEIFEGYLDPECYIDRARLKADNSNLEELKVEALLNKTFIDSDELEKFNKREVILTSDLINLLMDIPEIVTVKSLMISSYDDNGPIVFKTKNDYCLHLNDPEKNFEFILDYFLPVSERRNKIVLFKGLIPYKIPADGIGSISSINYSNGQFADVNNTELAPLSGSYQYLDNYYPVQNDFPPVYLVGKEGISDKASALRKSQRLQLKGYLMFYEQILANFLSQLNNITGLLSWKSQTVPKTYFSQEVNEVTDRDKLIDYQSDNYKQFEESFESGELAAERKNRFLNHLLARFNENFDELSLLKSGFSADAASASETSLKDQQVLIEDKSAFLRNYIRVSRDRSHAFNYTTRYGNTGSFWDTENLSGLEVRAGRKLGIDTVKRRKLLLQSGNCENPSLNSNATGYDFEKHFGLHIVEHTLLRPRLQFQRRVPVAAQKDLFLDLCCCDNNTLNKNEENFCDDPYSMRLTVVFPGWDNYNPQWQTYEQYIQFRRFVEGVVREEAPAHVAIKICWIDACQMENFERAFEDYFQALSLSIDDDKLWNSKVDTTSFYASLKRLLTVINQLKNHYKGGYLHDCTKSDPKKRPFVLNSTAIGGAG